MVRKPHILREIEVGIVHLIHYLHLGCQNFLQPTHLLLPSLYLGYYTLAVAQFGIESTYLDLQPVLLRGSRLSVPLLLVALVEIRVELVLFRTCRYSWSRSLLAP